MVTMTIDSDYFPHPYTVLYRKHGMSLLDSPLSFLCEAMDGDHAEEKCLDIYPDADVLWVVNCATLEEALDDYYGSSFNS